nr:immunoglobulin heavy chain junction region [Macaca mulatta]MOX64204.1 immunoglobulin heavy chain junction region [Macaca mulatta]MOX65380.1 immunoglobulin heavy chain junction region [Macaca mulatta]MOX66351.1 immunoglobulin heavy chain junction region [Macaca mulatta]MOX68811.1 immunoglobulin heavy chain junction region [Macaca mulatta]
CAKDAFGSGCDFW